MHDFVAHVLRRYYAQTDWNPYNSYLYLTSSSQAVLDFAIPSGLSLSISASPSPPFFATYRLRALPQLTGALGYVFASIEDADGKPVGLDLGGSSRHIQFKDFVERFRIVDAPRQPLGKDEVWHGGRRIDRRDYLLYGCMHIPSTRVDALVTTRLSPTWQLLATAISVPPRNAFGLSGLGSSATGNQHSSSGPSEKASDASLNTTASAAAAAAALGPPPGVTNLQINLQRDTGRLFTEYSYSVDDGLLGFRVLHNLGYVAAANSADTGGLNGNAAGAYSNAAADGGSAGLGRVDEDTGQEAAVGGGLRGRFSVGAELFVSPLEKSAGLSTGMRFTTVPEPTQSGQAALAGMLSTSQPSLTMADYDSSPVGAPPSQPPTTITATLNPMMGHLSTAYAARMTRDIVACSRFDFNVYSYESELGIGAEYWLRSNKPLGVSVPSPSKQALADPESILSPPLAQDATSQERRLRAREQGGLSLREGSSTNSRGSSLSKTTPWSLRERENDDEEVSGQSLPGASADSLGVTHPVRDSSDAAPLPEDLSLLQSSHASKPPALETCGIQSTALGVLKARISTSGIVALMWCGRLRNCLVSAGIRGDLAASSLGSGGGTGPPMGLGFSGAGKPLRGVGIDIVYFSQHGE